MTSPRSTALRATRLTLTLAAVAALLAAACGSDPPAAGTRETPRDQPHAPSASSTAKAGADAPDTGDMAAFVLAKINASPGIGGTATLVEFRRKSVSTQPLGDRMRSAVVEFEGIVTFSKEVSWSWQGPTSAGAPQRFEARAEYVNQGQRWQLVEPIGIYPL
jgi:hypothetical protein